VLTLLGELCGRQGAHDRAVEHLRRALSSAVGVGDRIAEAAALDRLGETSRLTGDLDQAHRHWQQALTIYKGLDLPEAEQIRVKVSAYSGLRGT